MSYGNVPISFVANQGQTDEQVKFLARGRGYSLFLTPAAAVLSLRAERSTAGDAATIVRMRLVGANPQPHVAGLDLLPGKSNYFIGDASQWRRDVPNYARVKYSDVYRGIDIIYYGNQHQLEYDLIVAPHADPTRIALAFDGVQKLSLDTQSNLVLQTAHGNITQHKPVIYQDIDGKREPVHGHYVLRAKNRVGFHIARYDTTQPLVIDPVLSYSTYLGGNGNDIGYAVAVDSAGNAYVTGETLSTNFPGTGASLIQSTKANSIDVFVTKFNAAGSALIYSTYLGGSGGDIAHAIAVDSTGNAYVTGETTSPTVAGPTNVPFPTTAGVFQPVYRLGGDAFVTKINDAGNALLYSTYLGGSGDERGYGVAVDSFGDAYVTGHTNSVNGPGNFPTAAPFQSQNASIGDYDAFVTKLNAAGSALVYSTYLGGNASEYSLHGGAISVDDMGYAHVGGSTGSTDFPDASRSAIQPTYGGGATDGFVVTFDAEGSALVLSTYFGGSGHDAVHGLALDKSFSGADIVVTGYTDSTNFPVYLPLQPTKGGTLGTDAFVASISQAIGSLLYSTYLGGSGGDIAYDVAIHEGVTYIAGSTDSNDFPTAAAVQSINGGAGDAFISAMDSFGSALLFSTYLGGSVGSEHAYGIALDPAGSAYVTGETNSTNFPVTAPFQAVFGGSVGDAFLIKITSLPSAVDDSYATPSNTPLTIAAPGVLSNDNTNGGGAMGATLDVAPTSGTLENGTVNSDGSFTYLPASDFAGTATFTYLAYNFAGASAPATVTITVLPPVSPPTDFIVTSVVNSRVTVTWRAPVTGFAPTGYVLEGGVTPGGVLASLPTNSTSTIYSFVAPTGAFFIRMHALAAGMKSAASNEVNLFVNVPAVPSAPANLLALVNGSTVALAWTNTAAGGMPSEIVADVTGSLHLSIRLPVSETFSVGNVSPGVYTVSLRASNARGTGPSSNSVTLTIPGPCSGVPGTPTNFVASKNAGIVTASWELPASGPAPTGYRLIVAGAFNAEFALSQRTISGAVGGGSYTLSVIATNACGSGVATAPQTVTIP